MQKNLIKACNHLEITAKETSYLLSDLLSTDEIIISSSGSLCLSAEQIDEKIVGGKSPQLLKSLQDHVLNEFINETN